MSAAIFLEKAQEALRVAQYALDQRCPNSAASRGYYAMFHAARAALIASHRSSVERRWSHSALQSEFARLVHSDKRWPGHLSSYLIKTLTPRELADYGSDMVSSRVAQIAVDRAAEFVKSAEEIVLK